jgi:hypothetical protein
MKKVVCSSVLFILLFCSGLFALPGIDEWMPTVSGEYVYYRDYTFTDETYIGFLQYDAGTYAVRYYSLGNTSDKKKSHSSKRYSNPSYNEKRFSLCRVDW